MFGLDGSDILSFFSGYVVGFILMTCYLYWKMGTK